MDRDDAETKPAAADAVPTATLAAPAPLPAPMPATLRMFVMEGNRYWLDVALIRRLRTRADIVWSDLIVEAKGDEQCTTYRNTRDHHLVTVQAWRALVEAELVATGVVDVTALDPDALPPPVLPHAFMVRHENTTVVFETADVYGVYVRDATLCACFGTGTGRTEELVVVSRGGNVVATRFTRLAPDTSIPQRACAALHHMGVRVIGEL